MNTTFGKHADPGSGLNPPSAPGGPTPTTSRRITKRTALMVAAGLVAVVAIAGPQIMERGEERSTDKARETALKEALASETKTPAAKQVQPVADVPRPSGMTALEEDSYETAQAIEVGKSYLGFYPRDLRVLDGVISLRDSAGPRSEWVDQGLEPLDVADSLAGAYSVTPDLSGFSFTVLDEETGATAGWDTTSGGLQRETTSEEPQATAPEPTPSESLKDDPCAEVAEDDYTCDFDAALPDNLSPLEQDVATVGRAIVIASAMYSEDGGVGDVRIKDGSVETQRAGSRVWENFDSGPVRAGTTFSKPFVQRTTTKPRRSYVTFELTDASGQAVRYDGSKGGIQR